ncbi:MAG: hypothetical protein Q4B68_07850 [Bacteroidales bacterium]|nr:hypothetical protein [Bacteroidales bacterium]
MSDPKAFANFPIWTFYECSESEIIYNAEDLINVNPGQITKLGFAATRGEAVASKVTVWIENTDDEEITSKAFHSTDLMQKVYEENITLPTFPNTPTDPQYWEFEFAQPFNYTGGGIRVHVSSESSTYCMTALNFVHDGTELSKPTGKSNALRRKGLANWGSASFYNPERAFPIIKLTMSQDTPTGIVTPVVNETKEVTYYNVYGQKVAADTKGLVISSEGKKFINK